MEDKEKVDVTDEELWELYEEFDHLKEAYGKVCEEYTELLEKVNRDISVSDDDLPLTTGRRNLRFIEEENELVEELSEFIISPQAARDFIRYCRIGASENAKGRKTSDMCIAIKIAEWMLDGLIIGIEDINLKQLWHVLDKHQLYRKSYSNLHDLLHNRCIPLVKKQRKQQA